MHFSRKKAGRPQPGRRFYEGLRYLKQHYGEPIGVNDLVKASKMSRRGLHKAFVKHVGRSPGRELRRLRIERALRLLIHSRHSQKAVAKLCGYRSLNSFWVSFREVVGKTPEQFRLRLAPRRRRFQSVSN